MPVEVIGIDHVFVAVRDMDAAKGSTTASCPSWASGAAAGASAGIRRLLPRPPARVRAETREGRCDHDPYAPGLHHLCFRVVGEEAVDRVARELSEAGVEVTEPRYYPEYGPDYYATFFEDPDGIRLEVMNFRELRRKTMYDWEARADL